MEGNTCRQIHADNNSRDGMMKDSIVQKLYTQDELERKIECNTAKLGRSQTKNDYPSIASVCYDLGRLYEILGDREKSQLYYQKVVDEWNTHPHEVPDYVCVNALEALKRPEEALEIVLAHAVSWDPEILADLYEEMDRKKEAQLIYIGKAYYSWKLSEIYRPLWPFWHPHYLQKAADFYEKAEDFERTHLYNEQAMEAWEKIKENIEKDLELIEEAWLYEEVGYIYEKAGKLEIAMEYYERAKATYEQAYDEDPSAVYTNQVDGDWDEYRVFFASHIPDLRLMYFRSDGPEENDYRRMRYRILKLKEQRNL